MPKRRRRATTVKARKKRLPYFKKSRVPAGARNVRTGGFTGIEKKYLDSFVSAGGVVGSAGGAEQDPAANASCLNAIAQGDGASDRDGRRVVLKSVVIRGSFYGALFQDEADVKTGVGCRLMVVLDTQTNGAQLNSEDVLLDGAGEDWLSHRNLQYTGRFRTLVDKFYVLPMIVNNDNNAQPTTISEIAGRRYFTIYKNLDIPVTFSGPNADIANITDNSLHVIAVASSGSSANLSYQARVRFVG